MILLKNHFDLFELNKLHRKLIVYKQTKKSSRSNRVEVYEEPDEDDYEGEYQDDNEQDQENEPYVDVPFRKTGQTRSNRAPRTPRRVRYVRPKSTVKIFQDQQKRWSADPKIDFRNDEAMEVIRNAPKKKIFNERVNWTAGPKIDSYNEQAEDYNRRPSARRSIFDEKINWQAEPKIDSHNEQILENMRRAPKRQIYDEKFSWPRTPRIDNQNERYLRYKERERVLLREKQFSQNYQTERHPQADRARIDHRNPEFEEYKKRRKSAKLPPIEDRKLQWEKKPRINQRNDEYIERIRQKRSIPLIFHEKPQWNTKTPAIDARNEEYIEKLKAQTRPKILSHLPRWRSEAKIDTYNDFYEPGSNNKPSIINEKLRWHARPKIDTGLESDPDDEEEYDYDLTT